VKGAKAKFDNLVTSYGHDLYRFAFWLAGDAHVAEDLVQETLLRAWRSFDRLQDVGAARSWLLTTLRRENARRFERQSLSYQEPSTLEWLAGAVEGDDPDDRAELHQRLLAMPAEDRELLLLQVLYGYSLKEIAEITGCTPNAAGVRLHRVRQRLQTKRAGWAAGAGQA